MKRFFSLLLIIAVASHFCTIQIFAQKRVKRREVIVIEFTTADKRVARHEALINRTPKTDYKTAVGGGAGCGDCSREEAERLSREYKAGLGKRSYGFTAKAWRMGKNRANLNFGISVGGNCGTEKPSPFTATDEPPFHSTAASV